MHRLVLALCVLLMSVAFSGSVPLAHAQPELRETVIVTAAAAPVAFDSLARSVTVLTREQIARLPAGSVADVLRFALGLDVRARGPFGVQTDFSIRGATFGQALVLIDGVRINNAQSGHHNGDLPVPLDEIERIEVLHGAGSSVHGADAFGGTINVITRRGGSGAAAAFSAGQSGFLQGSARWAGGRARSVAVEAARSSGFMFARDFETATASARLPAGRAGSLRLAHVRKEFGANGFYGPSPSREWTNQTMAALERRFEPEGPWTAVTEASYRTHGDRFLWDVRQPGVSENQHRTHAVLGRVVARRMLGARTRLTLGGDTGGDWLNSTNLGVRRFARAAGFAELQYGLGERAVVYPGLRYDAYSSFGSAWSPSLSGSVWLAPAVRWRAAGGRAFRVPTFTELYYRDPAHQAGGDLAPETAWSLDTGVDWLAGPAWLVSAGVFSRHERDAIDWIRESPLERWRSANIRRVRTTGLELELRRFVGPSGFAALQYSGIRSRPDEIPGLSKYVLEHARHALAAVASVDLPAAFALGQRVAFIERADGRRHWVSDLRLSRPVCGATVFVEGANLFDTRYQEVAGVEAPGRWMRVGVQVGR